MTLCSNPFIRSGPHGVSKLKALTNEEARLAATPFGCGQCMACRINKSRVWQHRILLESYMYEEDEKCWFTATYHDLKLPEKNSLKKQDFINWIKSIRKALPEKKIRYFGVGEYGEYGTRGINPHYHAALFGVGKSDFETLAKCWNKGRCDAGEINRKSAAYIVGYICKGMTKGKDIDWYSGKAGKSKFKGLEPEFVSRSTGKPGGLGVDFVYMMARKLKESPYYEGQFIKNLKHGKETWPLGRYLTDKLNYWLESDEQQREIDFWAYQTSNIIKNMKGDSIYVENVIEEDDGKRESKLWWQKNIRRKRDLRKEKKQFNKIGL